MIKKLKRVDYGLHTEAVGVADKIDEIIDAVNKLAEEMEARKVEEPRPCPFCGAKGVLTTASAGWYVYCANLRCHCRPMSGVCASEAEAVAQWNRRVREGQR